MSTKMRGSSEGDSARGPLPSTPGEREGQAGFIDRRASASNGFNPARLDPEHIGRVFFADSKWVYLHM